MHFKKKEHNHVVPIICIGMSIILAFGIMLFAVLNLFEASNTENISESTEYAIPKMGVVYPGEQDRIRLTSEEVDMIAQMTMAESEGESYYGQRLVIDTILNRLISDEFPNTVKEVLYQKNAFEPIENGRFDKCYPDERLKSFVLEETRNRVDPNVLYFCAGHYSACGTPMYQVGGHYFSY